jgi:SOS-response transcriptional repressor LexA
MLLQTSDRPLTGRQREVLRFLVEEARAGRAPSVRDITEHFGAASPSGMLAHLRALAARGYLAWHPKLSRSIRVVGLRTIAKFDDSEAGRRLRAALEDHGHAP